MTGRAVVTVDDYIATLPEDRRGPVEELRRAIATAAPAATETIAYLMPAFRSHGGQFLVSFAAFRKHYSLFPASAAVVEALGDELAPYLAGKGTIRFPADAPAGLARRAGRRGPVRREREGRHGWRSIG